MEPRRGKLRGGVCEAAADGRERKRACGQGVWGEGGAVFQGVSGGRRHHRSAFVARFFGRPIHWIGNVEMAGSPSSNWEESRVPLPVRSGAAGGSFETGWGVGVSFLRNRVCIRDTGVANSGQVA